MNDPHQNPYQQPPVAFNQHGPFPSPCDSSYPVNQFNFPPPPIPPPIPPPQSYHIPHVVQPVGMSYPSVSHFPPNVHPYMPPASYPSMAYPLGPNINFPEGNLYCNPVMQNVLIQQHPPQLPVQTGTGPTTDRTRSSSVSKPGLKKSLSFQAPSKISNYSNSSAGPHHYLGHTASHKETKALSHEEYSSLTPEEIIENEKRTWTRCAPADLYYTRDTDNSRLIHGTAKLQTTIQLFQQKLIDRGEKARKLQPSFDYPSRKNRKHGLQCSGPCKEKSKKNYESETSSSDSSSDESDEVDVVFQELERKKKHPARLHPELWFNDPGEMNDGPLCRCRFYKTRNYPQLLSHKTLLSFKARRTGIRHGIYAGETSAKICQPNSNNGHILRHYRVTISPPTNFLLKRPTVIHHDGHEFIFEGFSLLSHYQLGQVPTCKVIRFNIEYT